MVDVQASKVYIIPFNTVKRYLASHLLQPLDVSVVGPMKAKWKKAVTLFMRDNGRKPTRRDFFTLFTQVFEKTATMTNIKSGFRSAGIYPLNRQSIMKDTYLPSDIHGPTENVPGESILADSLPLLKKVTSEPRTKAVAR